MRQKISRLQRALEIVDRDVDRAAALYLSPVVERGYLKFCDFLKLLVTEIRRKTREEIVDKRQIRMLLHVELQRRIDQRIEELLPVLKGNLARHLTLQALIMPSTKKIGLVGQVEVVGARTAVLRGTIGYGKGVTPEAAYNDLRERLVLALFADGPEQLLVKQLGVKNYDLARQFESARPYRMDEIEGFRLEARIIDPKGTTV
jgi:hypothetical protein